jgi:chromosome segregation ATPase
MSEPVKRDIWCGESLAGHEQDMCYCRDIAALRAEMAELERALLGNVVDGAAIDTTIIKTSILTALRAQVAELEQREKGYLSELADYSREVSALRLRIKAVDQEHLQLADDRATMVRAYEKLQQQLVDLRA